MIKLEFYCKSCQFRGERVIKDDEEKVVIQEIMDSHLKDIDECHSEVFDMVFVEERTCRFASGGQR